MEKAWSSSFSFVSKKRKEFKLQLCFEKAHGVQASACFFRCGPVKKNKLKLELHALFRNKAEA